MGKLTTKLLMRAARLAEQKARIQDDLSEAFVERYGTTYSDVDADGIIDILDYGGGDIDLAQCDAIMTEAGHPPLSRRALSEGEGK
jgi:hypothetical protein